MGPTIRTHVEQRRGEQPCHHPGRRGRPRCRGIHAHRARAQRHGTLDGLDPARRPRPPRLDDLRPRAHRHRAARHDRPAAHRADQEDPPHPARRRHDGARDPRLRGQRAAAAGGRVPLQADPQAPARRGRHPARRAGARRRPAQHRGPRDRGAPRRRRDRHRRDPRRPPGRGGPDRRPHAEPRGARRRRGRPPGRVAGRGRAHRRPPLPQRPRRHPDLGRRPHRRHHRAGGRRGAPHDRLHALEQRPPPGPRGGAPRGVRGHPPGPDARLLPEPLGHGRLPAQPLRLDRRVHRHQARAHQVLRLPGRHPRLHGTGLRPGHRAVLVALRRRSLRRAPRGRP